MPFVDWSKLPSREVIPGYTAQFVHAEHMTMASWSIEAGARMPEHSHPHEQLSVLLEGRFELTLDGEKRELEPGVVAVIPSGVPHGGRALTECRILDTFHPLRDDYR